MDLTNNVSLGTMIFVRITVFMRSRIECASNLIMYRRHGV